MSEHTAGQWKALKNLDIHSTYGRQSVKIAQVGSFGDKECLEFSGKRWFADAHLIAAVPSLLAALKPFANFACDLAEGEECACHNCNAKAAIQLAGG